MTPQVGDIWAYYCKPLGGDWDYYHLFITEFYETVQYRNETCAARCLVLETGSKYEIYANALHNEGRKVA